MNAQSIAVRDRTNYSRLERPIRYIQSHAALRGVAALLVVAYHLQFGAPYRLSIETATPFFRRSYLMVDFFFILSGFVISLTSNADRRLPFESEQTWRFYVARLARIYPLHLFCLCVILLSTVALTLLRHWHHPGLPGYKLDSGATWSFFAELFLVQAWIPGAPFWNIPSWSISAEMTAYFCFPLLVNLRSRIPCAMSCLVLPLALVFYLVVLWRGGSLDIIAGLAPLRCLSGFAIGVMMYDVRHAVTRWPDVVIAIGQFLAVAAIIAMLAIRVPDPAIIPFFALLVIATWQDRGPIPRLLRSRALRKAGEWSYSVYLNHVCAIGIVVPVCYSMAKVSGLSAGSTRITVIVFSFAVTLLLSRWTYANVEQAGRAYVSRLLLR